MQPNSPQHIMVFMETYDFGGPAKNLLRVMKLLEDRYTFSVCTYLRGSMHGSEFIHELEKAGITVHILKERFRYDPKAFFSLWRCIRTYRPAILQIHNAKSRLYVALLKTLVKNFPTTLSCYHGETWTDAKQQAYNKLDRWLFGKAEQVVVVSDTQKKLLSEAGVDENKICRIYNGIPITEALPRKEQVPPNILTLGRFSHEKGQKILLEALILLSQHNPELAWQVTLAGDGPDLLSLQDYVRNHPELENRVRFPGYIKNPDTLYPEASIYVLPSLTEGIPNVLLEAALNEVPIISTSVGGVPEMFELDREAILIQPHDANELARALAIALQQPKHMQEIASRARLKVEQKFSMEQRAGAFHELYTNLLASE